MKYRKLGNSGIEASEVAFGCFAFSNDNTWGPQDEKDSAASIHAALDAGITLFDTAEGYGGGLTEEVLGRALAGRRGKALIATKASSANLTAEGVAAACEASLKRLGTDWIDLYQIHWPNREVPMEVTFAAIDRLVKAGKVRAVGVSNFGVSDLTQALGHYPVATNQMVYSLLARAIEYEILPLCVEKGVGILTYSPLAQGLLSGKYMTADDFPAGRARTRHFSSKREQVRHGGPGCEEETFAAIDEIRAISKELGEPMSAVALAWLLTRKGVASVICGGRTPAQVLENVRCADITLPADVTARLDAATQKVKSFLGPNPDMWSDRIK